MRLGSSSAGAIQRISQGLRWTVAFLFCAVIFEANGQGAKAIPSAQNHTVVATRIYAGSDGQSHIEQVPIAFHNASAAVVHLIHDPLKASTAVKTSDAYLVQGAPGTVQAWHNADRRRYIVVVSGEADVTTTDGEKLRLVPGQIYLAEDLTGKGHTFRVVGTQDWVALFVNLAQ